MTARRLGPLRLTGMAAPMAVWALHFVVVYSLQGLACAEGWQRNRVAGVEAASWWLLLMTLLALAAIAWLGLRAWRAWRTARAEPGAGAEARRHRFTASVTALLALLAAIAVVFTTIPVLLLAPCA
ncbi:hypothetical protein QFW77_17650 [Luteimonas sp. RD2P54]|uniref:Uncharacterized protein n=1 Tax=Luteimonas endophytica TaxID=3042023 RepID=A0ABT6JDV2_9GAMM|nr:hypothetical protein [Luteimonas endophytica]MDH5824797.1 hypothetical protein [Luteimonas endophytica]